MMEVAYLASIAPHQKNPSPLKKLLIEIEDPKPRSRQSADQMLAIAQQWTAALRRK